MYHGVRCGVIHPGYTDTPMVRAMSEQYIRSIFCRRPSCGV